MKYAAAPLQHCRAALQVTDGGSAASKAEEVARNAGGAAAKVLTSSSSGSSSSSSSSSAGGADLGAYDGYDNYETYYDESTAAPEDDHSRRLTVTGTGGQLDLVTDGKTDLGAGSAVETRVVSGGGAGGGSSITINKTAVSEPLGRGHRR